VWLRVATGPGRYQLFDVVASKFLDKIKVLEDRLVLLGARFFMPTPGCITFCSSYSAQFGLDESYFANVHNIDSKFETNWVLWNVHFYPLVSFG
jgi:hypothetical protein